MKHFSLTCAAKTQHYNSEIIPLLHRMTNLQELVLNMEISRKKPIYVDGTELNDEIVSCRI